MSIKPKALAVSVAVPLAVGGLAALISGGGAEAYGALNRPALSPPAWLFPVVWTALYILMGVAAYLVAVSDADSAQKRTALLFYGVQLFFNFLWPIAFFNFGAYWFAFVWILLLFALIFVTAVLFYRITPAAGWLLLPYLFWVAFASYLNFAVASPR